MLSGKSREGVGGEDPMTCQRCAVLEQELQRTVADGQAAVDSARRERDKARERAVAAEQRCAVLERALRHISARTCEAWSMKVANRALAAADKGER